MKYKKNADGTDMLDDDGNPIPEENAGAEGDETITPEEAAKLKKALNDTVEELKTKRKEAADLKVKFEEATKDLIIPDETTKVAEIVKKVLSEEKMSNAVSGKKEAFEKFINDHKEFHPDNDPTGLKREALETKLKRFNTESITDMAEYYDLIGEAQLLLTGNDDQANTSRVNNPYSSTPQNRMVPQKIVNDKLNSKERKLVERGSATEEQILKMREKRPAYLASLLERVLD